MTGKLRAILLLLILCVDVVFICGDLVLREYMTFAQHSTNADLRGSLPECISLIVLINPANCGGGWGVLGVSASICL